MTSPHILIVDDDLDTLVLISMVLEDHGYRVSQAESAEAARGLLEDEIPDLMVLDVMMPGEDGFAFARALRADPHTVDLPILMFTAKGLMNDKATGFEAGADDYLAKPVHPADLLARIRSMLARRPSPEPQEPALPRSVLACLGVSPGVGTTSVAANLALALAEVGSVVAVGPVAGEGVDGLSVLLGEPAALTPERVRAAFASLGGLGGVAALPGPASALHEPQLAPGDLEQLLGALAPLADIALFDLGAFSDGYSRRLLSLADQLILVAEPTRESLAAADHVLHRLREDGVASSRTSVVFVHRTAGGPSVNADVVRDGLGVAHVAAIPGAPELAAQAAASGLPLIALEPDSRAAEAYYQLAASLTERAEAR